MKKKLMLFVLFVAALGSGVYFYNLYFSLTPEQIDQKVEALRLENKSKEIAQYLKSISDHARQSKNILTRASFEYYNGQLNFDLYKNMNKLQSPMMEMVIYREISRPLTMARQKLTEGIKSNEKYRFHYARIDQLISQIEEYRKTKLSQVEQAEQIMKEQMVKENNRRANSREVGIPAIKPALRPREMIQNQKAPQRAMNTQDSTVNR